MARYYWTDREKQHCELWYSHVVDCAILICFFSVSIKNDSLGNICNIRHIEIVKYILSPIKVVPSKLKNFLFTQCLLAYCDAKSWAYFLILIIVDLTKASENLVNIVSALHWHWQHQAITRSTVDYSSVIFRQFFFHSIFRCIDTKLMSWDTVAAIWTAWLLHWILLINIYTEKNTLHYV